MRLFVALPIPEPLQNSLSRIQENIARLPGCPPRPRWVAKGNIHLTLKFLGEVEGDRLPDLKGALQEAAAGQPGFSFDLEGTGTFPERGAPRILWVGIRNADGRLEDCARRVDECTVARGFAPSDKPFSAHLTLARLNAPPKPGFREALDKMSAGTLGTVVAQKIFLMESRLQPEGAVYSEVEEFTLG